MERQVLVSVLLSQIGRAISTAEDHLVERVCIAHRLIRRVYWDVGL